MNIAPTSLQLPFSGSDELKESYSNYGQDIFVLSCLNGKRGGKFLDLGCQHPIHHNRTYLLENKFGWEGVSITPQRTRTPCPWSIRTSLALVKDCTLITPTQFDFVISTIVKGAGTKEAWDHCPTATKAAVIQNSIDLVKGKAPEHIDYLSISLSPASATMQCLYSVPFDRVAFSIITYTHDSSKSSWPDKFGSISSDMSRNVIESYGYKRICSNVASGENFVEDWYYNPEFVSYERIRSLESEGKEWNEIIFLEDGENQNEKGY